MKEATNREIKEKVSEVLDYIQKQYMGFIRWRIPAHEESVDVENALDAVFKSQHAAWLSLAVADMEPVISMYDLIRIAQKLEGLYKAQAALLAALDAQDACEQSGH